MSAIQYGWCSSCSGPMWRDDCCRVCALVDMWSMEIRDAAHAGSYVARCEAEEEWRGREDEANACAAGPLIQHPPRAAFTLSLLLPAVGYTGEDVRATLGRITDHAGRTESDLEDRCQEAGVHGVARWDEPTGIVGLTFHGQARGRHLMVGARQSGKTARLMATAEQMRAMGHDVVLVQPGDPHPMWVAIEPDEEG